MKDPSCFAYVFFCFFFCFYPNIPTPLKMVDSSPSMATHFPFEEWVYMFVFGGLEGRPIGKATTLGSKSETRRDTCMHPFFWLQGKVNGTPAIVVFSYKETPIRKQFLPTSALLSPLLGLRPRLAAAPRHRAAATHGRAAPEAGCGKLGASPALRTG